MRQAKVCCSAPSLPPFKQRLGSNGLYVIRLQLVVPLGISSITAALHVVLCRYNSGYA